MAAKVSKDEAAKKVAEFHFEIEPSLTHVFRIISTAKVEASPAEPIKLLEVNVDGVPAGVMPLHFGPAPASGIPYPSVIVEVTPEEFEQIKAKKLRLPNGWAIGKPLAKPKVAK